MSHVTTVCQGCGKECGAGVAPAELSNDERLRLGFALDLPICGRCILQARIEATRVAMREELGELGALEEKVLAAIERRETVSSDTNKKVDEGATFGQRLADRVATFGGSWGFIGLFLGILVVWMIFNSATARQDHFDPYPFILLNLVLSCVAALQAPVIMMSQNRQEQKDRIRAENDYSTNLKAELEVRLLHEKLDHLLTKQMIRLFEVQDLQVALLKELRDGDSR